MHLVVSASALTVALTYAVAGAATVVDNTPTTATKDGTISAGEYAGSTPGGNGSNSGFGNVVGSDSRLFVDSDAAGALSFGLRKGPADYNDVAVIYIDSLAGGFGSTAALSDPDVGNRGRRAVAPQFGSQLSFAPNFAADYAIALEGSFAGLYRLQTGSLDFVGSGGLLRSGNDFEIAFSLGQIGLSPGDSFDYVLTYGNPNGGNDSNAMFRSNQFNGAGFSGGDPGFGDVALGSGDFNTFSSFAAPVPEPLAAGGVGLLGLIALRRRR